MTTCTLLSDRAPDVAAGRSSWTDDEQRHLAGCVECRAEWDLVSAAARLGDGCRAPDASTTVAAVLDRLRADRSDPERRWAGRVSALLAAAAVVALLVWSRLGGGHPVRPASPPGMAAVPASRPAAIPAPAAPAGAGDGFALPELDSLSPDALDSMLRVLDEPLARADAWELPDLGDGGDQMLERAITGREG